MEITGKIIAVLPERSGVSARSGAEWRCATYVLETMEQYPRKMCFEVFGTDRIQQLNIQAGQSYTISFDIDAHEYQGRWFNSIRAWKAEAPVAAAPAGAPAAEAPFAPAAQAPFPPVQPAPAAQAPAQAPQAAAPAAADLLAGGDSDEGLPF